MMLLGAWGFSFSGLGVQAPAVLVELGGDAFSGLKGVEGRHDGGWS